MISIPSFAPSASKPHDKDAKREQNPHYAGYNGLNSSRPILVDMAKKPEPPKANRWNIYKIADKSVRLGAVEEPDESAAIEKDAAEFKVPATRLMAFRRYAGLSLPGLFA